MDTESQKLVDGADKLQYVNEKNEDPLQTKPWRIRTSVEPGVFFYGFATVAFTQLNQEYLYYRVEGSRNFPAWIEALLQASTEGEQTSGCTTSSVNASDDANVVIDVKKSISEEAAFISAAIALFRYLPPVFTSYLICSYIGSFGRRYGMAIPAIGSMINVAGYLVVEYTQAPLKWLYLGSFIDGVTGGTMTFLGTGYVYLCFTIEPRSMAFRFQLLQSVFLLGTTVTSPITGNIVSSAGFIPAFWMVTACYGMIAIYSTLCLLEPGPVDRIQDTTLSKLWQNLCEGFRVFFRKRPQRADQVSLILIFLVVLFYSVTCTGLLDIETLYATAPPFCLSPVDIGYLLAMMSFTEVFLTPLFVKIFASCLSEVVVAFICLLICLPAYTFMGFAYNEATLFAG